MTRLDPTLEEMAASLGPNATETDWSALHQAVEDRKLEAIRGDLRAERELPRLRPYPPLDLPNSTFKRFSPTRNRWPEIAEFDRRVDELERRQASVNDELDALKEQHRAAVLADRERLAAFRSVPWYISQTSAESVLTLLQADAEWIRNAQTADQRAELEGTDPRHDPDTVWADSPEGAKVRERQNNEARQRIREASWSGSRWEE